MDAAEKLRWMDEEYLGKYEQIELDSAIRMQKPFAAPVEIVKPYPVASGEALTDNSYLSYNVVVRTVLDKKLYQAFDVLDYALLSAPGAPLKQALIDAGIGMDIGGGYDNSTLQPVFSVIAKNANPEQKEQFLQVIRETLQAQVADGIDQKRIVSRNQQLGVPFPGGGFRTVPEGTALRNPVVWTAGCSMICSRLCIWKRWTPISF